MAINRVVLVGRLTRDPELRYTQSGVAVTTFTLAVDRNFKNDQGEYDADFPQIVAWRQVAEIVAKHLRKGDQCGIEGRLQTRSYEDREGRKVYVTEVIADNVQFLSPKKDQSNEQKDPFDDPFADDGKEIDINDEDLPF